MKTKWTFSRLFLPVILCIILLSNVRLLLADSTSPLCFTARNGSVTVRFDIKNVTHTIQYSTDSVNWSNYSSNRSITLSIDNKVYFRAASNQTTFTAFGGNMDNSSRFYFSSTNGGKVEGSGNIMSLYGPDCPVVLPCKAFAYLFYQCTLLTSAPELPAACLNSYCYSDMFSGCTSLTTPPTLPSTILAQGCYSNMFSGCTSLIYPPSLPATTLEIGCYNSMFRDCTSLTTAPSLPATTLTNDCYNGMFYGCTSLVVAPALPAATLTNSCYQEMFLNCTSLVAVPALPATTLAEECYLGMFRGCTSIVSPPFLPADTLAYRCYEAMFMSCSSLAASPLLHATTLATYCYSSMFDGCSSLLIVPTLPAATMAYGCYSGMFNNCTSLIVNISGPGRQWRIPVSSSSSYALISMFSGTSGTMNGTPSGNTTYYIASCRHSLALNVNDTTMGSVEGEGEYIEEEIATLKATPKPHYHLTIWSNGMTTDSITIAVMSDTNMTAYFEIDKHTISTSGTNGEVLGGGTFDYDSTIYLTAIPNNHYYFSRWSDGDTANPKIITVSNDTTYTAIFEGDLHTIIGGGSNGTVSGSGLFHYGSTATLTATADDHYHFVRWSDGIVSNPRTDTVKGDTAYTAIFEIDKHTVSASGDNGTVYGTGTFDYGSTDTLIADGNDHYHFVRWSDGDTANPKIITVTDDMAFTATFEIDKHTITVVGANGIVTGAGTYNYGISVILTAEADDHYHFIRWSDGTTTAQRTVVVSGDTTYTAIFEIDKHIVSDSCINGSVIGVGEYDYGSRVTITALPDEHYSFVSWLDGDTSETRTFVLTGDTVVSAMFDLTQYNISATCEHGVVTGYGVYRYPDVATLAVEPDKGYKFVEWSDGNAYNPRIFIAEEDLELEAFCEEVTEVKLEYIDKGIQFYCIDETVFNPEGIVLHIFSIEGRLIIESENNIDVSTWPSGTYIIIDDNGRNEKMVISH